MECTVLRTNGMLVTEGSFICFFRENKQVQGFIIQFVNDYEVIVRAMDSDVYLVALHELQPA